MKGVNKLYVNTELCQGKDNADVMIWAHLARITFAGITWVYIEAGYLDSGALYCCHLPTAL